MPEYMVYHAHKDIGHLWREHHAKSGPTDASKKANKNGELGLATPITAKTRPNAEDQLLAKFPEHRILDIQIIRAR